MSRRPDFSFWVSGFHSLMKQAGCVCCSFSLRERTKEHPRGAPLLDISPVPSMEWVGYSGAVEDCPLLGRIGGALSLAGGWVSRLKKAPLCKRSCPEGAEGLKVAVMHICKRRGASGAQSLRQPQAAATSLYTREPFFSRDTQPSASPQAPPIRPSKGQSSTAPEHPVH